jgi:hypothetical protein
MVNMALNLANGRNPDKRNLAAGYRRRPHGKYLTLIHRIPYKAGSQ